MLRLMGTLSMPNRTTSLKKFYHVILIFMKQNNFYVLYKNCWIFDFFLLFLQELCYDKLDFRQDFVATTIETTLFCILLNCINGILFIKYCLSTMHVCVNEKRG
jgi:hypothetical protein